jgi:transposase InsO family protein
MEKTKFTDTLAELLKKEGWRVGHRLIQRLRRELGLAIPKKKRKVRRGTARNLLLAESP